MQKKKIRIVVSTQIFEHANLKCTCALLFETNAKNNSVIVFHNFLNFIIYLHTAEKKHYLLMSVIIRNETLKKQEFYFC